MCGIVGCWGGRWESGRAAEQQLARMADALVHRGPDSSGVWVDENHGVALAHRRLAIVDLTAAGHQPMVSITGRYILAFNGEIYNHMILRGELEKFGYAIGWDGHSDTETLLACIEAWGVGATLEKVGGMFAIALWDREDRALYLARDRMGEKPLYYGWQKGVFLFGSELKALKVHPAFESELDRDVLALLLRHNCIPSPYSIYKGIRKLPSGTWLRIDVDSFAQESSFSGRERIHPYWSLNDVVSAGRADPFVGDDAEAVTELDRLLRVAVRQQMVADVPLGAFLSGGVDSSTVVALMQVQSGRPVKTFAIGFEEEGYNEARYAKDVARYLGTEHTELYVSPKEAMEVIPQLPTLYDEPFSDSSQIPTFLVSQMTRQHVTVSLSGDAGDELFGGYNRYFWANMLWRRMEHLPKSVRSIAAQAILALSPDSWNGLLGCLSRHLPAGWHVTQPGDKMHKLAAILPACTPEDIYRILVSHWKSPTEIVIGATELPTVLTDRASWPEIFEFEHRMMYLDAMTYLPDDVLVKVDRAAMGVSLETRVPFLDHRVVEFVWRLPLSMKIRHGQGKWILRQVLYNYVPKQLIERPKMGFGVPIDSWLRGSLRDWAENLLDESRLKREGYFHPTPIRQKWDEHLSGQRNWQHCLWDVLMFQAWLEKNI